MKDRSVSGIFDTLCDKYDNSFKMTPDNFKEAKEELVQTIEEAISKARTEASLATYTLMLKDTANIRGWPRFQTFIWQERLAREGLKTIKTTSYR